MEIPADNGWLKKIGAGDEIRTHDPNLGNINIALFLSR